VRTTAKITTPLASSQAGLVAPK